jgi:hypothetical protein
MFGVVVKGEILKYMLIHSQDQSPAPSDQEAEHAERFLRSRIDDVNQRGALPHGARLCPLSYATVGDDVFLITSHTGVRWRR